MTLVSAFFTNVNNDKSFEKYLMLGSVLLQSKIPKIIFVDDQMYQKIKEFENENTKIVLTNKEDIYLYKYKNFLQRVIPNTSVLINFIKPFLKGNKLSVNNFISFLRRLEYESQHLIPDLSNHHQKYP